MNDLTDFELVEQTRVRGDKQTFGLLLQRHQAGAMRMAKRIVAHDDTARELVQEAMLQAYLSLASLENPERFQSWLFGIVINVCRSYLRTRHYDPLSLEAIVGGMEATRLLLTSHAPDLQTMVEMRELNELVLSAIETLSAHNQQAVLLYYYEQLSLREISLILGISTTAVKGRLHKSRRQLASYFTIHAPRESWLVMQPGEVTTEKALQERKQAMIEVELVDVVMVEEEKQGHTIIILLDDAGQRILPMWVGPFEGHNIAIHLLSNNPIPRPMTYDFMANLLQATGAVLEEIQISALQDSTYFATARLRVGNTVHEVDARPSDAMALALRMNSKISVAETIMEQAGKSIPEKFQHNLPRKGLADLAAKMEKTRQEYLEMVAKAKEVAEQEEAATVNDRLFTYIFGE